MIFYNQVYIYKNGKGMIDRSKFNGLIRGYFEMNEIKQTQEVYDYYLNKLDANYSNGIPLVGDMIDSNYNNGISLVEFTAFVDDINRNEFIPAIENEVKSRDL